MWSNGPAEEITYETAQGAFKDLMRSDHVREIREAKLDYMDTRFYIGIDLADRRDFTSVSVIKRQNGKLLLMYLKRYEHNIGYPETLHRLKSLANTPRLRGKCIFIFDGTGVGRGIVQQARINGLHPTIGIFLVADGKFHPERNPGGKLSDNYILPKADLATSLKMLFENNGILISKSLKEGKELKNQIRTFWAKKSDRTGFTTFEAWHNKAHDDNVISVGLAAFWASQLPITKMPQRNVTVLRVMR